MCFLLVAEESLLPIWVLAELTYELLLEFSEAGAVQL